MSDINTVTLVGRLTRDAALKYTNGGMAVCELSVAVNARRKKGEEWVDEASFFDVVVFGKRGEAVQKYLTKGKQVGISGTLKQDRWQDKETGKGRSKVHVIANDIMLLGGKDEQHAPSQDTLSPHPQQNDAFGDDDLPGNIPF